LADQPERRLEGAPIPYEERLRVLCHLPVTNPRQELKMSKVIDYLRGRPRNVVGGYTLIPPFRRFPVSPGEYREVAFTDGWWWSDPRNEWVRDTIAVLIVDFVHPAGDFAFSATLYREIDDLRQQLFAIYNMGLPPEQREEEFWVVAHPLLRFTSRPRQE
jgi:hypothetical protein